MPQTNATNYQSRLPAGLFHCDHWIAVLVGHRAEDGADLSLCADGAVDPADPDVLIEIRTYTLIASPLRLVGELNSGCRTYPAACDQRPGHPVNRQDRVDHVPSALIGVAVTAVIAMCYF